MSHVTTHVLDTAGGLPARGVAVVLTSSAGEILGEGATDADGRIASLGPDVLAPGTYRLTFETGAYWADLDTETFFPSVTVTFSVGEAAHYHVPLLLSPFAHSTYRGS